jgi:uncharacterized protein with GYD domain
MARFVVLMHLTAKGATDIHFAPQWVRNAVEAWSVRGGRMVELLGTLGPYDFVALTEAPDDETAAKLSLLLAETGVVTATTMRAFDFDSFYEIIDGLGEKIERPPRHPIVEQPERG